MCHRTEFTSAGERYVEYKVCCSRAVLYTNHEGVPVAACSVVSEWPTMVNTNYAIWQFRFNGTLPPFVVATSIYVELQV